MFTKPLHLVLCLLSIVPAVLGAQDSASIPERTDSFVASTESFVFFSDATLNLHDFLLWNARSPAPVEPMPACLAALPNEQQVGFNRATEYYGSTFTTVAGERLLLALRFRLAGYPHVSIVDPATLDSALAMLQPALPAYEACWWGKHDERNRSWIAELIPLLESHENVLHERLATLFGQEPLQPLPVDVVGYAGLAGASSVANPHHILVSSARESNSGYSALEIVFHEASHTIFGPRTEGPLWEELIGASETAGTPLPRDFWHALLFFTTGRVVQAHLAGQGVDDYVPYVYSEGLFTRAWPAFREPLERVWQPYLNGDVTMEIAARQMVAALAELP